MEQDVVTACLDIIRKEPAGSLTDLDDQRLVSIAGGRRHERKRQLASACWSMQVGM